MREEKFANVRAKPAAGGTPDKQGGTPWRPGRGVPYGPRKPLALGAQSGGGSMTMGGLFPSMLCLSGLNALSGLLPPPLLLFSSTRAARRVDPASQAALPGQTLPQSLAPGPSPQAGRGWAGWGLSVPKAGAAGGKLGWMGNWEPSHP